ncbi:hypothetical protein O181_046505 [Austropuccinia psidii MF-1]|uniref:Uncharacterized protein n=1 Tax=Austropuccinia psidii MF-1 TaxID=1389203 RepID=A0A9Q3DNM7_9BASI|nr:hypothetical protein [Austropuccinia psidii MF-1]
MMTKIIGKQRLLVQEEVERNKLADEKKVKSRSCNCIVFTKEVYQSILELVRLPDNYKAVCAWSEWPHPEGLIVLSQAGYSIHSWKGPNDLKIIPMPPHNCIQYNHNGVIQYALVNQIYKYSLQNGKAEFSISINPILNIFAKDPTRPSKSFQFLCYLVKLVIGQKLPQISLVSPSQITNLMAYCLLDPGTFGIQDNLIAMVPFDHLGYLAINEPASASLF